MAIEFKFFLITLFICLFFILSSSIFSVFNAKFKGTKKLLSLIVSFFITLAITGLLILIGIKIGSNAENEYEEVLEESVKILNAEKGRIEYVGENSDKYNYIIKIDTKKYGINYDTEKEEIINITEIIKIYERN
jgi:hypothetical protein